MTDEKVPSTPQLHHFIKWEISCHWVPDLAIYFLMFNQTCLTCETLGFAISEHIMRYKGASTEINISMKISLIILYFINICMQREERICNKSHILYISYRSSMCKVLFTKNQFSSVQSLRCVRLFAIPWIAARQASLSITNSRSSLRLTSIESVMPSSHLIFCRPPLLLPPIPSSIRVFSNEYTLLMRWPKYWSFRFSIIPSKEIPGLISFWMDWLDLLAVQGTLKSLLQHHSS